MPYSTILLTIEQGIARLTLNRPDRLNAFTSVMHEEVAHALATVAETPDMRVLVLTGAGRGFCAGQDLGDRTREPGQPPFDLGKSVDETYNPLVRRLASLPFPIICAVNGVAAGAGANIALACDLVVAKASARFIQSFSNIGLLPDSGGTWTLPRLVGPARALGLVLTGEPLGAEQAQAWGMIWRAVPDEAFEAEVDALAEGLASAPPLALAAAKRALRSGLSNTLEDQLDIERDLQRTLGFSDDYAEGVAAFREKRSPQFKGR